MAKPLKLNRDDLFLFDWTPEQLKIMRKRLGLTHQDIAKLFDITPAAISHLENGKTQNPMTIQMYGILLERIFARKEYFGIQIKEP